MSKFSMRAALLGGASLAAMVVAPAWAQAQGDTMETVIVTGIRGSLQRSLDIKRESGGLVDAISMEDIGKFPDSNLAAALMRIPGVTVTRANSLAGPTTGQPTQVTVRGFGPTFNVTLFDGRVIPSGVGGRAFDFSGLSADMVSALEVYKTPDPSVSAGAIGATINVKYPKPFDYAGFKLAGAASGTYAPDDGRITPNANFLISDTFAGGKFGILVAGAYSSLSTTQMQVSNWGWIGQYVKPCQLAGYSGPDCNSLPPLSTTVTTTTTTATTTPPGTTTGPTTTTTTTTVPDPRGVRDNTKPVWFTQDYAIDYNWTQEERINLRAAVQFQPNDNLLITVDGNFSRDSVNFRQWSYAIWNNVDEMRNITTSKYGTINSYVRNAPTDFDANHSWGINQTHDFGINLKYNVTDKFTIVGDFDQSLSSLNPDNHVGGANMDIGYGPSQGACTQAADPTCPFPVYTGGTNGMAVNVVQPGGHKLPYYVGYGPNGNASTNYNNDAQFLGYNVGTDGILGSHVMVVTAQRNRNITNQAKIEGQWAEENLVVKAGLNYVTNHFKSQGYNDFAGNRWQSWSGYGPDSNNYFHNGGTTGYPAGYVNSAGHHIPASFFTGTIKMREIPGWTTVAMIPGLPKFDQEAVYKYLDGLGHPTASTSVPGFNWQCCLSGGTTTYTGTDYNAMMVKDPNGFQHVYEDNYAFYVSASTNTHLGSMPLKVNAGLRYEYTDLESSGIGRPLTGMVIDAADHTAYDFSYGTATELKEKNQYSFLLPNVDLILSVTDDLQLRLDASRTMTRPPLGNMNPNTSYGGRTGSLTASGGNPKLMPYQSDNLDVSADWFYAPNSYVGANVFLKNVTDFVVSGTTHKILDNVIDPYTNQKADFVLSSTINGPKANVYGLELAWQHVFGDTGFGYLVNGTIVQTDKNYDPNILTTGGFSVPGLADSANFTVFYDKDGFEVRVAANWRDTYLNNFGQSQGGTSFVTEPVYVNTAWSIDLSTSYDITDNVNAYFEVNNLLDQAYSTRGRWPDQVLDVVAYGRRFTFGMHYKM